MNLIDEFNEFYMKELSLKSFEDQHKINEWLKKKITSGQLAMPKIAEIEEMQKQLGILKTENEKLKFMIDKGLGWEDMINDISYPPRD